MSIQSESQAISQSRPSLNEIAGPDAMVPGVPFLRKQVSPVSIKMPFLDLSKPSKIDKLEFSLGIRDSLITTKNPSPLRPENLIPRSVEEITETERKRLKAKRALAYLTSFNLKAALTAAIGACSMLVFYGTANAKIAMLGAMAIGSHTVQIILTSCDLIGAWK